MEVEPLQVCYDFSGDKIIFETVIGLLVLCLLAVLGKANQGFIIDIVKRVYTTFPSTNQR